MLSGWIIVIAIFGLNSGLLRFISIFRGKKENAKIKYIFKKSFYLLLITGLLGGVFLFTFSSFVSNNIFKEPQLTLFLRIFSIVIPLSVLLTAFLSPLKAYEKIGWYSFISNILGNVLHVFFILLLILVGLGTIAIPLSYLFGSFAIFIVSIIALKIHAPVLFKKAKIHRRTYVFKDVLSYSWPLIFAAIIGRVFQWTDSFFIGFFSTAADVGLYNAAVPISLLLGFSPYIFTQMFEPLINKEFSKKNMNTIKQLTQQVGKWVYVVNLPIFILILIFPGELLNILFGSEYIFAENALRILIIGAIFISISEISARIITMLGKSKMFFFDIAFTAIINLVLNIFLIPKYGIDGAAFSTSLSSVILSFIFIFQAYKQTGIMPIRRKNLNITLAVIISLVLLLLLKNFVDVTLISLILLAAFFVFFYIFLVIVFKGLDKNDFMVIRSFFKKLKK